LAGLGPKPAAAGGGKRQAERRESQGAAECCDYASSPDRQPNISEKLNRTGAEGDAFGSFFVRQQTMPYSKRNSRFHLEPAQPVKKGFLTGWWTGEQAPLP